MATRIRVIPIERYSFLVTGTDNPHVARKRLPAEVARWGGTSYGYWVRRNGRWHGQSDDLGPLPADARIGVHFGGCLDIDGIPVYHDWPRA